MVPPRIAPLDTLPLGLPPLPAGSLLYRALTAGALGGVEVVRGDLVVCRRAPNPEGAVVLEARGLGRPRLGCVLGATLLGDAGEPCSPLRWRVAGELAEVLRPEAGVWARIEIPREQGESGLRRGSQGGASSLSALRVVARPGGRPKGRPARGGGPQLSLFQRAA